MLRNSMIIKLALAACLITACSAAGIKLSALAFAGNPAFEINPARPETIDTATYNPQIDDASEEARASDASSLSQSNCPVTQPPMMEFVPPYPLPAAVPDGGGFRYGSEKLWTMISSNGIWTDLPHDIRGYTQKIFFWKAGYSIQAEPVPNLSLSGFRLDGDAPPLLASQPTHGYNADLGSFMIAGMIFPTAGCWQVSGHYQAQELTFVVWVD
jgi:hypothetical protein